MLTSIKKTLCFSGIFLGLQTGLFAQTAYLKAADEYYNKGDYYAAAQLYEKWLGGKSAEKQEFNPYTNNKTRVEPVNLASKPDATYRLAESYYKLHQFAKAEPLFKAGAEAGNKAAGYYYAKSLKFNGKAEEAHAAFQRFAEQDGVDAALLADANLELASFDFARAQLQRKDLGRYNVRRQDALNSIGATYAPAALDNQLVFTSTRQDNSYNKKNPHANKLYRQSDSTSIKLLDLPADIDMEQGIASFNPAGTAMYLTKWQLVNGKKVAGIYRSVKAGESWGVPVLLGETVNVSGASSSQPFITTDGKWLLFSSDRAGGMGGKDLWYVGLDDAGNPTGVATNLRSVNSAGDDEAPFYHAVSKALVFSSNGRVGMGGYDLFMSKGDFTGTLQAPVNMGYPVNSIKDDIYYLSTSPQSVWYNAWLSSDRSSECCLELFAFDKLKVKKLVAGKVLDCKDGMPVIGASVIAKDPNGKEVFSGKTDATGQYSFLLDDYTALQTSASAEGYDPGSIRLLTPTDEEIEIFNAEALCINKVKPKPVEINKTVVLDNVLYDFGKATLSKASYPVFDTLISWMEQYPEMVIELSAHTDNIGSDEFNQTLSEKRAQSCVDFLVSRGIARERIIAKGYGETQPVAPNQINGKDNPDGRKLNRRTEFKVLHY